MADEQAMARMRLWWQGLDADTQMMFDKLYRSIRADQSDCSVMPHLLRVTA